MVLLPRSINSAAGIASTAGTDDEVLDSPLISTPLHRLDCCVITDGGGALVVVSPEVARDLERRSVKVLGHGEAVKHANNGNVDLTYNEPDLQKADLVRAIDKGARNAELLPHFPDRPAFVLDPITLRAERIR